MGVALQAGRASQQIDTLQVQVDRHDDAFRRIDSMLSKIREDVAAIRAVLGVDHDHDR